MKLYLWQYSEPPVTISGCHLPQVTRGLLLAHANSTQEARALIQHELDHTGHWEDAEIVKVLKRRPTIYRDNEEVATFVVGAGTKFA